MILEGTMTCYGGYFPAPRVTYRKSKQSYGVTSNARGEVEGRTVSAQKLLQESETERRELQEETLSSPLKGRSSISPPSESIIFFY